DYVRLIRTIRPDVVISLMPTGNGGGQHHQASAVITHDAVKLAGDATKYPDQLKDGLRPWQPKKFYFLTGFGFPGEEQPSGPLARINLAVYDPLLGKTYQEIGTEARSMHKCQGMAQLLSLPGPAVTTYQLSETTLPGARHDETSLFDGIDTSIIGLSKFVSGKAPKDLMDGLTAITAAVTTAQKNFETIGDQAVVKPLLDGLFAVRVLRRSLRAMSVDDQAKFDIDFRLRQKEREFQQAALLANGVLVEALADDGIVVPGQDTKVAVIVANRGAADVNVKSIAFDGFQSSAACTLTLMTRPDLSMFGMRDTGPLGPQVSVIKKDQVARCEPTLKIPANARIDEPYWHRAGEAGRYTFDPDAPFGLPFRPTPFLVTADVTFAGTEDVLDTVPVRYRYQGNIFSGEKRTNLLVVPPLSVRVSPEIAIVPSASIRSTPAPSRSPRGARAGGGRATAERDASAAGGRGRGATPPRPATMAAQPPTATREIEVTVVNDMPGATDTMVTLDTPAGWSVTPPQQPIAFTRSDESRTVRFAVAPAANTPVGQFMVRAKATLRPAQGAG